MGQPAPPDPRPTDPLGREYRSRDLGRYLTGTRRPTDETRAHDERPPKPGPPYTNTLTGPRPTDARTAPYRPTRSQDSPLRVHVHDKHLEHCGLAKACAADGTIEFVSAETRERFLSEGSACLIWTHLEAAAVDHAATLEEAEAARKLGGETVVSTFAAAGAGTAAAGAGNECSVWRGYKTRVLVIFRTRVFRRASTCAQFPCILVEQAPSDDRGRRWSLLSPR